jgi:hypothetical protein
VSTQPEDLKAHERMRVILAHLEGRINATQAAQTLGVWPPGESWL